MIAPQYERKPYADTDDEAPRSGPCALCNDRDPQRRTWHHLTLVKHADLDGLRAHLTHEYVHLREAGKQRRDVVDSICTWVQHLMYQYSWAPLADEGTGATWTWWQVRDHMARTKQAMAEACYQEAPEAYRKRPPVYEATGFTRVEVGDMGSTLRMRQPGEEEVDDWPPEEPVDSMDVDPELLREEEAI